MKNANEMRKELAKLYSDLRANKVERQDVKELTNICGKMISSAMAQVKYNTDRNAPIEIEFLNEPAPRTAR